MMIGTTCGSKIPRRSSSANQRSSGASSSTHVPGPSRHRIVFPDYLGPVTVTTANRRASSSSPGPSVLGIISQRYRAWC